MKSSTSLVLIAAAALLALSLGVKIVLAGRAGPPPVTRGEELRRFLVANVGPIEPIADGWRFTRDGCQLQAFPSGKRDSLDMDAASHARRRDRIAYVYRGRVSDERPAFALAFDVIAYMAAKPFRPRAEPGYVVLIVGRECRAVPDLPWSRLPA